MLMQEFSLPPLVEGPIEGRLDVIILRPTVIPAIISTQSIDVIFTWWGSNTPCIARLTPDCDELKLIFNIHSDSVSFNRYFQDAKQLVIELYITREPGNRTELITSSTQQICTKFNLKYKKEWKSGERIGKFVASELKLNVRGEYVTEGSIINGCGEPCGSLVVFILYTSDVSATSQNMKMQQTRNEDHAAVQTFNSPFVNRVDNESKAFKFASGVENLSPRFISFETRNSPKSSKKLKKKTTFPIINSKNKLKSEISQVSRKKENKEITSKPLYSSEYEHPFSSDAGTEDTLPNKSFILTRLFSFVDSGAIQYSDLPILIQICQGRSPSLDFSTLQNQKYLSTDISEINFPLAKEKEKYDDLQSSSHGYALEKHKVYSVFDKEKESKNFSNVTMQSGICPLENLHTHEDQRNKNCVFDADFLTSLAMKKDGKTVPLISKHKLPQKLTKLQDKLSVTHTSEKELPENKGSNDLYTDSREIKVTAEHSLLILKLNCIKLKFHGCDKAHESPRKSKQTKCFRGRPVRQQSRICYFVQVSINFDKEVEYQEPALFVSRQVESNVIIFKSSKILKLLEFAHRQDGFLKIKVIRHKMGERSTEEIGVGVISLDDLVDYQDTEVVVPLWIPVHVQDNSCDVFLKELNIEGGKESPMGNLHFKVAFALVKAPIEPSDSKDLQSFSQENCSEDTRLALNPATACGRVGFSPTRGNPIESYHWNLRSPAETHPSKYELKNEYCNLALQNVMENGKFLKTLNGNKFFGSKEVLDRFPPTIKVSSDHININNDLNIILNSNESLSKHPDTQVSSSEMNNEKYLDTHVDLESASQPVNDFVTCKSTKPISQKSPNCNERLVHLEILEGKRLPLIRLGGNESGCSPNCYVKTNVACATYLTEVIQKSSFPKWNYKAEFKLVPEYFNHTNGCLILRVCHSHNGWRTHPDDPILGFASIETSFLWNSFISICGWVPVLDLYGKIVGELKVSLTPMFPPPEWQGSCDKSLTTLSIKYSEMENSSNEQICTPTVSFTNKSIENFNKYTKSGVKSSQSHTNVADNFAESSTINLKDSIMSEYSSNPVTGLSDSLPNIQKNPVNSSLQETIKRDPQIPVSCQSEKNELRKCLHKPYIKEFCSKPVDECFNSKSERTLINYSTSVQKSFADDSVCRARKQEYQEYISEEVKGLYLKEAPKERTMQHLEASSDREVNVGSENDPIVEHNLNYNKIGIRSEDDRSRCSSLSTTRRSTTFLESFSWMNQLASFDTPCASFVDICSSSNPSKFEKPVDDLFKINKPVNDLKSNVKKKKKCRIAAKFDLS